MDKKIRTKNFDKFNIRQKKFRKKIKKKFDKDNVGQKQLNQINLKK